jgi:hypothetical protein
VRDKRNGKWQDLVDKCLAAHKKIKDSGVRQEKLDTLKESRRVYGMVPEKKNFPWENAYNVVQPFLAITVDNLEPRIVSSFTGREPYVQFNMTGVQEPDDMCEFIENWFNNELKEVVDLNSVSSRITHDLLLDGTVFPVASYEEDTVIREDFEFDDVGNVQVNDAGEPVMVETEDQVFQGGRIDFVDFKDIFIPDNSDNWEKTDVIRIIRPTYSELLSWSEQGKGYMNVGKELLKEEVDDESRNQKVIECLEYHVTYIHKKEHQKKEDITNWTEERYVALIAIESETIVRLLKLRDLNLQNQHVIKRIRLYPEGGCAYGCSLYEKMRSIQDGASDTFNLMMNSAFMALIPWFLYSDKTGLPDDVEIVPGRGIKCDDPGAVNFPKIQNNVGSFVQVFNVWVALWERLGSIGNLQVGKPAHDAETATETMLVIQEGNIKHNYQAAVMKTEFVSMIKTLYDLYYKNMPFDKTFFYHDQEVSISRMAMRRPYSFRLTGSTDLSNKVLELRVAEQMYTMLRQDPLANPVELYSNVIKSFKPDAAVEKYISPEINQLIGKFLEQKEQEAKNQEQLQ